MYDLKAQSTFTLSFVTSQTILTLKIEDAVTGEEYGSNSIIISAGFTGTIKLQTSADAKLKTNAAAGVRILVNGNPGTPTLSSIAFSGIKR